MAGSVGPSNTAPPLNMAKAGAKPGDAGGKARATASPTATAARKASSQSKAVDPPNVAPAIAASSDSVEAQNESSTQPSLNGDDHPDEEALLADVSSILDPLVMHSDDTHSESHTQTPPPPTPPTVSAPATASTESTRHAAQLLARQHAEYQRSVELVRQQLAHRHMQQMHQTQQQHLHLQRQQQQQQHQHQHQHQHQQQLYQQQQTTASAATSTTSPGTNASMMHHIQQRIQERIQQKQLYDQIRQHATAAHSPDAAAQQQLQIQQYHAMIRELEIQAAAAAAAAVTTPSTSSTTASSAALSQEELERMRQDRLHRLHHMQVQKLQHQQLQMQMQAQAQHQHAAALQVTLTGVPPAAATADPQALQQRAHVPTDPDRVRQQHEQQQQQGTQAVHAAVMPPPDAAPKFEETKPSPTAMKTPSKKRAAEQVAAGNDITPATGAVTSTGATLSTVNATTPSTPAMPPKKKRKTPAESQMEGLVRVLCRLQLSKTESEMRTQLEKFGTWIHKSADACLLRFALRDFVEVFGVKQKQFETSALWLSELLPKCTFTHDKLRHAIAVMNQLVAKPKTEPDSNPTAPPSATATTPSRTVAVVTPASTSGAKSTLKAAPDAITLAAREHAYAALKEQMLAHLLQPKPRATPTPKAVASSSATATATAFAIAPSASGGSTEAAVNETISVSAEGKSTGKKKKRELSIDVNASAIGKIAKTTANGAPAALQATPTSTASSKPPLYVRSSLLSPTPSNTVISPRVAQHLFDLELAPRSCAVAPDEGEERFYFPTKPISNIMRRVLPGGGPTTVRRRRKKRCSAVDNDTENNVDGDGDTAAARKKREYDEEDDDDGEGDGDGEGEGEGDGGADGADDGEDHEGKEGDDDEETKIDKEALAHNGVSLPASALSARSASAVSDEPPVKIDDDALTFMQECVTEFLLFFTSEARDQAAFAKKKGSITGLNLIHALDNLGFIPYAKVLANYNDKVRKVQDEAAHQKQERKNLAKQRKLEAEKDKLKELQEKEMEQTKQADAVTLTTTEVLEVKTELPAPATSEEVASGEAVVAPESSAEKTKTIVDPPR